MIEPFPISYEGYQIRQLPLKGEKTVNDNTKMEKFKIAAQREHYKSVLESLLHYNQYESENFNVICAVLVEIKEANRF